MPHLDALHQYGLYLTKNRRDAEDLTQDSFLKAYRFFDRYEPGTNCKAWLFRIMTNTFLNKNRRNVKEFAYIENVDTGDAAGVPSAGERSAFYRDPERDLLSHTVHDKVKRALDDLPADFRTVVLLADLQDFTYREIAEVMDCPVGTVMSRLFRARKALQKKLYEYALSEGYIQGPPAPRRKKTEAGSPGDEEEASEADADPAPPPSLDAWRERKNKDRSALL